MNEADFRKSLQTIDVELKELLAGERQDVNIPDAENKSFTIDQKEVLRRISWVKFSIKGASDDCKACRDNIHTDAHSARQVIAKYLSRQLNAAEKLLIATYMKSDRSHSETVLVKLTAGKLQVISKPTAVGEGLQTHLYKHQATIGKLDEKILPKKIGDYQRQVGTGGTVVLFKEEIKELQD